MNDQTPVTTFGVKVACRICGDLSPNDLCPKHHDLEELDNAPLRLSFCTRTYDCLADVDGHDPDCPVEKELRKEFGF